MTEEIVVAVDDRLLMVTLSRPEKVNAMGKRHLAALADAVHDFADVAGVIISGSGGNFSSGFDRDEHTGTEADEEIDVLLAELERAIDESPVPVLAAVEGACVGAAVDLAAMCDIAVAGESAFFAVPSVRLGIVYRTPAVEEVARRAPQAAALMFLAGRRLTAHEALGFGLIGEVAPAGSAVARSRKLLTESGSADPRVVAETKRVLRSFRPGASRRG